MEYSNISELLVLDSSSLSRLISKLPFKNGLYNLFFKISDKIGLKLSLSKSGRDYSYDMQRRAALEGLGPETYGIVDNVNFDGKNYFGQFVEIVKVIEGWTEKDTKEKNKIRAKYGADMDELSEGLIKIGYNLVDYHIGNVGWKRGRMILIDFDEFGSKDLVDLGRKDNY